jgi:hypothetical protein
MENFFSCEKSPPAAQSHFTLSLWPITLLIGWIIVSEKDDQKNNFQVNSNSDNYSGTWCGLGCLSMSIELEWWFDEFLWKCTLWNHLRVNKCISWKRFKFNVFNGILIFKFWKIAFWLIFKLFEFNFYTHNGFQNFEIFFKKLKMFFSSTSTPPI